MNRGWNNLGEFVASVLDMKRKKAREDRARRGELWRSLSHEERLALGVKEKLKERC